mmetsp:Transcript_19208/g.19348  ORF Transcript_19208/g.19348 Transcript_19208/m.19348 type:complete len:158 (-) Transcript_19208:50-523(-)
MCLRSGGREREREIGSYLLDLTKQMSSLPFPSESERLELLQITQKMSIKRPEEMNDIQFEAYTLEESWVHMLAMIPGISTTKARYLTNHYPTPQSLYTALYNPSVSSLSENHRGNDSEKESLIADKLSSNIRHVKLAKTIYNVMTITNVDAVYTCNT